jgi:hypothetical protein
LPKPSTMVERLILCDLKGAVELGQYGKAHPRSCESLGVMVVVRELMRSWTQGWTRWQGAVGRVGEVRASSSWLMRGRSLSNFPSKIRQRGDRGQPLPSRGFAGACVAAAFQDFRDTVDHATRLHTLVRSVSAIKFLVAEMAVRSRSFSVRRSPRGHRWRRLTKIKRGIAANKIVLQAGAAINRPSGTRSQAFPEPVRRRDCETGGPQARPSQRLSNGSAEDGRRVRGLFGAAGGRRR